MKEQGSEEIWDLKKADHKKNKKKRRRKKKKQKRVTKADVLVMFLCYVLFCFLLAGIYYFYVYTRISDARVTYSTSMLEEQIAYEQQRSDEKEEMKALAEEARQLEVRATPTYDNLEEEISYLNGFFEEGTTYSYSIGFPEASGDVVRRPFSLQVTASDMEQVREYVDELQGSDLRLLVNGFGFAPVGNTLSSGNFEASIRGTFFETLDGSDVEFGAETEDQQGDEEDANVENSDYTENMESEV